VPWAKGAQNGGEKWVFCNGYNELEQIGMKFGHKTSIGVLY